jgi:hypothetical protein
MIEIAREGQQGQPPERKGEHLRRAGSGRFAGAVLGSALSFPY